MGFLMRVFQMGFWQSKYGFSHIISGAYIVVQNASFNKMGEKILCNENLKII